MVEVTTTLDTATLPFGEQAGARDFLEETYTPIELVEGGFVITETTIGGWTALQRTFTPTIVEGELVWAHVPWARI